MFEHHWLLFWQTFHRVYFERRSGILQSEMLFFFNFIKSSSRERSNHSYFLVTCPQPPVRPFLPFFYSDQIKSLLWGLIQCLSRAGLPCVWSPQFSPRITHSYSIIADLIHPGQPSNFYPSESQLGIFLNCDVWCWSICICIYLAFPYHLSNNQCGANSISRYRVICSLQTHGLYNLKNCLEKKK